MIPKSALRSCPICGGREVRPLHWQSFALGNDHPVGSGYEVVACSECGFAYADTPAKQADFDLLYSEASKYADSATSTGAGSADWDLARLRRVASDLREFAGSTDGLVADIGCANGGLLKELKQLGFEELLGVDPSAACVRHAEAASGAQAVVGSLFDLGSVPDASLGGAILSHVLEHVCDLQGAMTALDKKLAPGAWLYIEVPDASRYKDFLCSPFQDFNTEHINHFSVRCLENFVALHGFVADRAGQKEIFAARNIPYPAAFVFARKTGQRRPLTPDSELEASLRDYVSASGQMMQVVSARIDGILNTGQPLVVWGTGQLALKLLSDTSLKDANIAAFVDSNPIHQGKTLRGIGIISPDALKEMPYPILIASLVNVDSIQAAVDSLGLTNPVLALT
jgi:SAM-dependent methyltransferase